MNDVGDSDHVPFETDNTCDTAMVPDTNGATEFTGNPATTTVDAEYRAREPVALTAVTETTTNFPASDDAKEYVDRVADEISEHVAGKVVPVTADAVHRYH